eukprot:jgi/Mesvir1/12029/Mv00322-RA.1
MARACSLTLVPTWASTIAPFARPQAATLGRVSKREQLQQSVSPGPLLRRSALRFSVQAGKGFGTPEPEKPKSKSAVKREEKASTYDKLAAEGKPAYAIFIRKKGEGMGADKQCQWFPVGPMVVENPSLIVRAIFDAEKDLVDAALRMYPALIPFKLAPGLEYGYRLRDAPQMSEAEIKAGGDPFANVVVAKKEDIGGPAKKPKNPVASAMGAVEAWMESKSGGYNSRPLGLSKRPPPRGDR